MEKIKNEIKNRLGVKILNEVETDEAVGFEVRIEGKRYHFYSQKDQDLTRRLLAFIYRIQASQK